MKILYFLDRVETFGGAANNLLHQASAMQQSGDKVLMILPMYTNGTSCQEMVRRCQELNLDFKQAYFDVATSLRSINIIKALKDLLPIEEIIEKEKPEIVHSLQLNMAVSIACRKLKIHHIMSIYSILKSEFLIPYTNIFAQYLITDSEYYKDIWKKGLGIEGICIRNSLDKMDYKRKRWNKKEIQILILGHLYKSKNQLEAIKMLLLCRKSHIPVHLTICGYKDSLYAEKCIEYIKLYELQDMVTLAGFVPDVFEYLEKADLLLCASLRESFPFSITEAMMMHVPVLSTRVAGIPEIIQDKENGYLSKGSDSNSLFETFLQFYNDLQHNEIDRITENAFQIYLKENTPQMTASYLKKIYKSILCSDRFVYDIDDIEIVNRWVRDIYQKFCNRKNSFDDPTFVKSHLWNIYHILNSMFGKSSQKIYIWGAGKVGRDVLHIIQCFFTNWRIMGFIDSIRTGNIENYQIFKPDKVDLDTAIIVLGIQKNSEDVILYLENQYEKNGIPYLSFV